MERIGVGLVGKRILGTNCMQSRLEGLDGEGVSISLAPCDGAKIEAEKSEVQFWTVLQIYAALLCVYAFNGRLYKSHSCLLGQPAEVDGGFFSLFYTCNQRRHHS